VGSIVRVNGQTFENQDRPVIASFPDGGVVVAWQSGRRGQQDVLFRQLQPDGTWLRSESYANAFRLGDQVNPSVAVLLDNTFVVVWTSRSQFGMASRAVMGQRFARNGTRVGGEFRVDDVAHGDSGSPCVIPAANGGFSVLWTSDATTGAVGRQLQLRQFGADSAPAGPSAKVTGVMGDISEFSASSSPAGIDLVIRHARGANITVSTLSGSTATDVRQFPATPLPDGLSVRSGGGKILCAWINKRADGLGSAAFGISIDRANPASGSPAKLSEVAPLAEGSPSLLWLNGGTTVAVWSKMSGSNGFDVVLNAQ
jgi:hypothetical protein